MSSMAAGPCKVRAFILCTWPLLGAPQRYNYSVHASLCDCEDLMICAINFEETSYFVRPGLVLKIFKIFDHIESLDAYIKH